MNTVATINSINFNYYFLIGGLFLSYLVYRIFQSFHGDNFIETKYRVRGHTWRCIECNKSIPYNIYCAICGILMLPLMGLFCECCGLSACKKCFHILDNTSRCKQITWPPGKPFLHLWVIVGTVCRNFVDDYEEGDNLKKYFCSWCQRTKVSRVNLLQDKEECDFLKYRDIIIPPTSVCIERGKIISIRPLDYDVDDDWEPLFILCNRKSGSDRSDEVHSIFRGLLNPLQIIDISIMPPERIVKWLPEHCKILVAGGDGTVSWVLNTLHAAPHIKASVGILPMGTGNDLARSLGWGAGCSVLNPHSILNTLEQANIQILDRWKITIKPKRGRLSRLCGDRVLFAYNYASVGVDAQVALDFDRARSQFLYRYASRYLNYRVHGTCIKMAYALLGVGRALDDGGCGGLERRLRVGLGPNASDNLTLPPLQALVVLNIPSWGAGVDLWSLGSEQNVGEQRMDDGKLEIVGVSSSFHIARLQCGLAKPYRFAQTSNVRIDLDGSCAMQVDGEPWMQGPATILVEPAGHSTMLRRET